jgi:predicted transcriptional regulator of viral defense system
MSVTAEGRLARIAAGQWGMLTAAQATADGIARSTLARREKTGTLERMRPGVYRLPGTPADRLEDIRAAWLASDPTTVARDRLASPDVVVGGAAAAWGHGLGDLYPAPYLLYTAKRRQTGQDDVRYSRRHLPSSDVMILDGLPVTTRERTIADLLDEGDLSLVADALRDAERADNDLDVPRLISHLDTHARRLGHASGAELYAELRTRAGLDAERLQDLVVSTDLTERLSAEIGEQMQRLLASFVNDDMNVMTAADVARNLPRVNLPESALPKITLPPAMEAMLRDLAERGAVRSPQTGARPARQERGGQADGDMRNEENG